MARAASVSAGTGRSWRPGVKLMRVAMLQPLRRAAEQRVRAEAAADVL